MEGSCSRKQPTKGRPPIWGLGEGLTIPHHKKVYFEILHMASELVGSC